MRARMRTICLLVVVVTALGCQTAGKRSLFARPAKTTPDAAKELDRSDVDEAPPEREPLVAGNSTRGENRRNAVDPALQRRIDQQLQQLPPQQRSAWENQLSSLTPGQQLRVLESLNSKPQQSQLAQASPGSMANPRSPETGSTWSPGHAPLGSAGRQFHALTPAPDQPVVSAEASVEGASTSGASEIGMASGSKLLPLENGNRDGASPEADSSKPRRFPGISEWDKSLTWLGQRESTQDVASADSKSSLFGLPQVLVPHVPSRGDSAPPPNPGESKPLAPARSLPPITAESNVWEDELLKLVSLLEADATVLRPGMSQSEQREYLRRQIALRMLYLVENAPERAQQVIAGIPETDQEFWSALFWGLSSYVDDSTNADPALRATMTVDQLRAAVHHLQTKAHLQLANLTFCQGIHAFGNYDPFEADRFEPGQTVLLYSEVRNFASEQARDGEFRSRMRSVVEIFRGGESNELASRTQFDASEDRSRTPRSDYYHSYRIDLPRHLVPGSYLLKLTVEDEVSGKLAVESIAFEIR